MITKDKLCQIKVGNIVLYSNAWKTISGFRLYLPTNVIGEVPDEDLTPLMELVLEFTDGTTAMWYQVKQIAIKDND